jgi:hypothetical protein
MKEKKKSIARILNCLRGKRLSLRVYRVGQFLNRNDASQESHIDVAP